MVGIVSVVHPSLDPSLPRVTRPGLDWSAWTLVAMAAAGLGIGAYLTTLHYAGASPLCASGGAFDCGAVVSSRYSFVPGTSVPITVPGMLWFAVSGGLAAWSLRERRRGGAEPSWLRPLHALWGAAGLAFVLYLVYAELVLLHRICEWCTGVHVAVFISLLLALSRLRPAHAGEAPRAAARPSPSPPRPLGGGSRGRSR
jgi:uncharacterized membrane protein